MSKNVSSSIFKQDIKDSKLGMISMYQKVILDTYNLDEKIFSLNLLDKQTGREYVFGSWSSVNSEDTVYEYMENRNISIEELEMQHNKRMDRHKIYNPTLEKNGI